MLYVCTRLIISRLGYATKTILQHENESPTVLVTIRSPTIQKSFQPNNGIYLSRTTLLHRVVSLGGVVRFPTSTPFRNI